MTNFDEVWRQMATFYTCREHDSSGFLILFVDEKNRQRQMPNAVACPTDERAMEHYHCGLE
jgi:hypothetical protein